MALKPCRECGQPVSTSAKACPSCGVGHPTKGALSKPLGCGNGCLVLIVVIGIGVVAAMFTEPSGTAPERTEPAGPLALSAEVRRSDTQLFVTNASSVPWTECSIHINPGLFSDGYVQRIGSIGAGDTASGGLMAFVDGDGARFNPGTHVVQSVDVRCQTPNGEGWYSGTF